MRSRTGAATRLTTLGVQNTSFRYQVKEVNGATQTLVPLAGLSRSDEYDEYQVTASEGRLTIRLGSDDIPLARAP